MSKISRRQFLRGLGGFTLTLPFLESLAPLEVLAATDSIPKRLFTIIGNDGYFERAYYPSVEASTKLAEDIYYMKLNEIPGDLSLLLKGHFDSFRDKMNIYRGLDIAGSNNHDDAHMLCSAPADLVKQPLAPDNNYLSIDRILIRSSRFYSRRPEFEALYAKEPSQYNYSGSWDRDASGETIKLPYTRWPKEQFKLVFSSPIQDPTVRAKFNADKALIGDLVLEDYKKKLNHRRISSVDKVRLSNFVDELHELNKRIIARGDGTCEEPQIDTVDEYWNKMTEAQKDQVMHNHIDIIIAAMKCDLTRIGSLFLKNYGHNHGHSHTSAHDPSNWPKYIDYKTKELLLVKRIISRLNAEVDPANGKSMLDNSIVFWGNECSQGYGHRCESMPAITFGSAGGAINTGYYVDYRQRPFFHIAKQKSYPAIGRSYTQFLITIMQALGLRPEDYHKYGDGGGFGYFDRNPRYSKERYVPYEKFRNDPLPLIMKAS